MVSIIIATYNRAELLIRAVNSILNQKYCDFEIVIVDDNSSDGTEEKIKSMYSNEMSTGKIVYVRNEERKERNSSRNIGLKRAKGNYIGFLDDDDEFCSNHLAVLVEVLDGDSSVSCVFADYYKVHDNGDKEKGVDTANKYKKFSSRELCILGVLSATCSALFRREAYERLGGFKDKYSWGENKEFYSKIAIHYNIKYVDIVTNKQHIHHGSYSDISLRNYAKARKQIWEDQKKEAISSGYIISRRVKNRYNLNLAWFSLPHTDDVWSSLVQGFKDNPFILFNVEFWVLLIKILCIKFLKMASFK